MIFRNGIPSINRLLSETTNSVLAGNITSVGTVSSASSNGTTTITKNGHGLSVAAGDLLHIQNCTTAADKGFYRIVSSTANTFVVDRALSGTDSDILLTVYKDVIGIFATDGVSGQRIMNYSHQNKPLQIGGDTLVATSSLTSDDVTIGGRVNFPCGTNDDGIVFGSLGTATKAIDLSSSNLSGDTDYQIYLGANDYWAASGKLFASNTVTIGTSGSELNFTGGNNRITFSGYRAVEGNTDGTVLTLGEQYGVLIYNTAQGKISFGAGTTKLNRLTLKGAADEADIGGTTTANATTAITGVGTTFLSDLGIGDRISLSSAAATYATVTAIASDTALTVSANLGDGTSQTINVKHAIYRAEDASGNIVDIINDQGYRGIGTATATSLLTVGSTDFTPNSNIKLTLSTTGEADLAFLTTSSQAGARNWLVGSNYHAWTDFVIRKSNAKGGDPYSAGTTIFIIDSNNNIGINTTSFGTTLANGLAMGNGTAATAALANGFMVWSADEGSRDGYAHPHIMNEAGQTGALAFQAPLVNLLSNSGFGVWSNGTLENVGSDLVTNGGFATDINGWTLQNGNGGGAITWDAGTDSMLFTQGGGSTWMHAYQSIGSLTSGKLYKITFVVDEATINLYVGVFIPLADTNYLGNEVTGALKVSAGVGSHTIVFEAITTTTHYIIAESDEAGGGTAKIDTVTVYEVTPATIAADTLGPDGHSKTSTLDAHEYWNAGSANTYGYGKYLLKLTKGADTAEYYNFDKLGINYRDVQGKKVTFGAYVYSVTATDNIKLSIYDGVSEIAVSSFVGADAITWIEVTGTVAVNATAITARVLADGDTSDVAYISEPIMIKGSSIGAGNYAPSPNETIYTEKVIALTDYTATTSAADATINLEAQSSGFIPKGVKAVLVKAYGKDSAAGDGVGFDIQSASGVEDGLSIDTQVNNIRVQGQGWVKANSDGDIVLDHRGSGASALTLDIKIIGIQP